MNQTGFWVIGVMVSAFFTLIWRRLDTIEKRFDTTDKKVDGVQAQLNALTGDFREFKGKTEALLSKPRPKLRLVAKGESDAPVEN